jgi:hypothetical protein
LNGHSSNELNPNSGRNRNKSSKRPLSLRRPRVEAKGKQKNHK